MDVPTEALLAAAARGRKILETPASKLQGPPRGKPKGKGRGKARGKRK